MKIPWVEKARALYEYEIYALASVNGEKHLKESPELSFILSENPIDAISRLVTGYENLSYNNVFANRRLTAIKNHLAKRRVLFDDKGLEEDF